MGHSSLFPLLGLAVTALVLSPIGSQAAIFNYNRVENISARPIASDDVLSFYGDLNQNEGYAAYSNSDRNAPDAGHIGFRPGTSNVRYYVTGREVSPDPSGASRTTTVENLAGFSNLSNYLNENNLALSSLGFGFGQKSDRDFTKTWNLGEDKLGQDWFGSPDSTIEESIYRANSNDVEIYLTYGTNKLIQLNYSDFYFLSVNDNPTGFIDNWNIFYSDPISGTKVTSLDPVTSGLADAFLQDVAAGGGGVQFVSEHQPQPSEIALSVSQGYEVITLSFPMELRVVRNKSIPEPASVLGLLMFGVLGMVSRLSKPKN